MVIDCWIIRDCCIIHATRHGSNWYSCVSSSNPWWVVMRGPYIWSVVLDEFHIFFECHRESNMEDPLTLEEELAEEHGLFFSILFIVCVFFGIFIGFFVSWFNLIYIALHKVSYPVWRCLHVFRVGCSHIRDTCLPHPSKTLEEIQMYRGVSLPCVDITSAGFEQYFLSWNEREVFIIYLLYQGHCTLLPGQCWLALIIVVYVP